jgi:hypothetical protein
VLWCGHGRDARDTGLGPFRANSEGIEERLGLGGRGVPRRVFTPG